MHHENVPLTARVRPAVNAIPFFPLLLVSVMISIAPTAVLAKAPAIDWVARYTGLGWDMATVKYSPSGLGNADGLRDREV